MASDGGFNNNETNRGSNVLLRPEDGDNTKGACYAEATHCRVEGGLHKLQAKLLIKS